MLLQGKGASYGFALRPSPNRVINAQVQRDTCGIC